jgi:molybdate transport system substrate-binding protein
MSRFSSFLGRLRLSSFVMVVGVLSVAGGDTKAGEVKVAVAANFTEAVKEIGAAFEKATGHKPIFSFGASGQFFTQITQGAPFEVFLSADKERPEKAVQDGYAVKGSLFTYATGRLVLFSKEKGVVTGENTLKGGTFTKIAIANPATAPYGAAAVETMKKLGVYETLRAKIVQGNNISQTQQFVDTGAAEIGFVALSQVIGKEEGSQWLVPEDLHTVIAQDAVLLKTGEANEAAKAFLMFLRGNEAKAVKEKFGYGAGGEPAS